MNVFISQTLRKQLDNKKDHQNKLKRFDEIVFVMQKFTARSELFSSKDLGFKKYRLGPNDHIYGIDFKFASAERIIASFPDTPEQKKYFMSESHNKESIILHMYVEHDDQEDAAKLVASRSLDVEELVQIGAFEQEELEKSVKLKNLYHKVGVGGNITAVLSEDKDKIVHDFINGPAPRPFIVPGIAGSGKTEIAIKIVRTLSVRTKDKSIAYVTVSDQLTRKVESQVQSINPRVSFHTLQSIIALVLNDKNVFFTNQNSLQNFYESSEMRDVNFNLLLKRLIENFSFDSIFAELNGTILGSMQISYRGKNIKIMSIDDYLNLPLDKSIFARNERMIIHKFASLYVGYLEKMNIHDCNIESMKIINDIDNQTFNKNMMFDYLIIDEIQDLTEVQFRMLFSLLNDKTQLFITGDPNQAINPTSFDMSNITTLLHNSGIKSTLYNPLRVNCRNSIAITAIINSVNEFRNEKISRRKIEYTQDEENENFIPGNVYFLENSLEGIRNILDGANVAIVTDIRQKKRLQDKYNLKANLFTVQEIKGLEYENVIIVDLLNSHKELLNNIYDLKKSKDNSLHYYFNLFYVGITRAQKNLVLVEPHDIKLLEEIKTDPKLKRMVKVVKSLSNAELNLDASAEGYFEKGTQLLSNGNYSQAFDCFEKCRLKNPNYPDLDRSIRSCEIYLENDTDHRNLAIAFESERFYDFAYKHFMAANEYPLATIMTLANQEKEKFMRDLTRFGIDILDLYGNRNEYDELLDEVFSSTFHEVKSNHKLLTDKVKETLKN